MRIILLVFGIALFALLVAGQFVYTLNGPAPSADLTRQHEEHKPSQPNHNSKRKAGDTEAQPAFIKIVPAEQTPDDARYEAYEHNEKPALDRGLTNATIALAVFTFFLFVGTAVLAIYTYRLWSSTEKESARQANEMEASQSIAKTQTEIIQRQEEISRQQFLATHRPRIILREAYAIFKSKEQVVVTYTLANTGGTSARIVESAFSFSRTHINGLHVGPVSNGKNDIGDILINAGEHRTEEFTPAGTNWADGTSYVPDTGYFLSGHIVYEGIGDGVKRHTAFFRRYDHGTCRFIPINDPQLEYCDERA